MRVLLNSGWITILLTTSLVWADKPTPEDSAREAFKKGVSAFQKKEFDAAAKALTDVPELGGYLSLYKHWYLGQALLEMGKYKESEAEFAKVETSQASSELKYQAQFLHAEAVLRQNKFAEATKRLVPLERKWRRSYRYPEVLYRLMVADLKLGHTNSVCTRARKLYSRYPAHPHVLAWGSDLSAVMVDGKKLPCATPKDEFGQRMRALQLAGESDKAHREIVALLEKASKNEKYDLDMILANFLVNEGSVDDALNLLIRYYPDEKSNLEYLTMLGRAAARSGEYQTAVGAYERASSISPTSRKGREALYQAAFLSYQFQDYDGAVRKFQQFAKANPRSGLAKDAQWHLAWLQYLRADYKGALSRFEDVAKTYKKRRGSDSLRERLVYWMAMSRIRLKQYGDARTDLESIVSRNPHSYYGLAAQARLENLPAVQEDKKMRTPTSSEVASVVETPASNDDDKETEESLAERPDDEVPESSDEVSMEDSLAASDFKDPAIRARIDVAQKLIELGLQELARWELWEVERRTRNADYLRRLITAYEGIGSFNRSATVAELNFAREREAQGLEIGRALWTSMFPQAYRSYVTSFSSQFGIPQEWVWAIMRAESMYKPDVISPVGARGLMQLMPYTARNLNKLAGGEDDEDLDLMRPEVNVRLGAQYLARLHQKFKGHLPLVAAAYNAGPHRVESWLVNFGHLETDEFVEHIPFLETRNYVKKVVRNHTLYRRLYAKDAHSIEYLAKAMGVPIPSRASTRESWESL